MTAAEVIGAPRRCVVHVVTSLDFGGVESHMATLGQMPESPGYRHVFCAIAQGGKVATLLADAGAQVTCLQASSRIPSLSAIWRLYRFFRRLCPDAVHTHGAEANFHGLVAAALARVPVRIGEEIGIPEHGRVARRVFALAYRCAHKVIGVSQCVSGWLVDSGEVPPGKAVTLLNPVRLPEGRGEMLPADAPFRVCFVGRLEPVKNLHVLVEGFAGLVAKGASAELWFIGDGSLRPALEQLASQRNVQTMVRFHGYQPAPAEWIRQCHVFVQPSLSEGFGLALVEAMGCEVPVVSTRVGAAPQIVLDGISGWLVRGFDATAIQDALAKAYATPRNELAAMGRAARRTVKSLFEPVGYMDALEQLYDATLAQATKR